MRFFESVLASDSEWKSSEYVTVQRWIRKLRRIGSISTLRAYFKFLAWFVQYIEMSPDDFVKMPKEDVSEKVQAFCDKFMRKLSSILITILLMLVASSMIQIVLGEPSQLTTRITQDYSILETGTVPILGTLTANDPSDTYGTWGGGVTKISMQIYWTPYNKGIYVGFYDVTHNTLYYTGPIYGGATFVTFFCTCRS